MNIKNNHKIILFLLFIFCLITSNIECGLSIVYNLRVAETTKLLSVDLNTEYPAAGIITPFGTFRKKLNHDYHSAKGVLGTLSYTKPAYYVRVDAAYGHVAERDLYTSFSRNQSDDVLFSGGYSVNINERTKITASGFLGLPVHKDTSLLHLQLGYGHIGLGAQVDGSYMLFQTSKMHGVRGAARCIHFLPRNAEYSDETFELVNFAPGNLLDFFASYFLRWNANRLEFGYDLNMIVNAHTTPYVNKINHEKNFIRSNFFGSYKYRFTIGDHPSAVIFALSYGFDNKPVDTGLKRIVTVWGSWTIHF